MILENLKCTEEQVTEERGGVNYERKSASSIKEEMEYSCMGYILLLGCTSGILSLPLSRPFDLPFILTPFYKIILPHLFFSRHQLLLLFVIIPSIWALTKRIDTSDREIWLNQNLAFRHLFL
jgi:hypothetical protein